MCACWQQWSAVSQYTKADGRGFGDCPSSVFAGNGISSKLPSAVPVSESNSRVVYSALHSCGIRLVSALPETWLVHVIRMAEEDPAMTLVRLAKEEEGVGVSAGAHFAGVKSAMLMQNHGFLASINGIVSFAQLYRIPLFMIVSYRGHFGERDPWQTQGGGVTEPCCARSESRMRSWTILQRSHSALAKRRRGPTPACTRPRSY